MCHAWCAGETFTEECHQELASPTVAAADCCESPATSLTAVLSSESRQEAVSPNQEAGAAQHRVDVPAAFVRLSQRYEPYGFNENRLVTVLRL